MTSSESGVERLVICCGKTGSSGCILRLRGCQPRALQRYALNPQHIVLRLIYLWPLRAERGRGGEGGEKGKEGEGMGEEGRGRDVVSQRQHYQFHDSHVHALHSTGDEEKSLIIRDRAIMQ